MTETPRVEAFIQARQQQVLDRALAALESADDESLPGEIHRLRGTLGTYGLTEAAALLQPLDELLKSGTADQAEVTGAREAALSALRALRSGDEGESG